MSATDVEDESLICQSQPTDPEPKSTENLKQTGCLRAYKSVFIKPWSISWYVTKVHGAECLSLYLWMLKDLAWVQNWFFTGMTSGFAVIAWSMYLLLLSIRHKHCVEWWHNVAQFLWLFGNFWWMLAELHDEKFPMEDKIYEKNTLECGYILLSALIWLTVYYVILRALRLLPVPSQTAQELYNETDIPPRIPTLFSTWRQYENLHILLWLAKDTAWNLELPGMWWVFVVPTVVVALDFVVTSSFYDGYGIYHVHYVVQLLWVASNIVWAYGELFIPEHNDAIPFTDFTADAFVTMRWYASWVLVVAFGLVFGVNFIWVVVTLSRFRYLLLNDSVVSLPP